MSDKDPKKIHVNGVPSKENKEVKLREKMPIREIKKLLKKKLEERS